MSRKIVITGASSQIGTAIAKRLAENENELVLQAHSNSASCDEIQEFLGKRCTVITADFTKSDDVDRFCDLIKGCDVVVNAAAVTITEPLPHLSIENVERMISVNIFAITKICQAVLPAMISKRKGSIVNISSVTATRGNRGQSVYAGTKGFIESFSRALAAEYGSRNIRVNCVAPGPIRAGSLLKTLEYAEKEIKESVVSKKLGTTDDVAAAVAFLISDDASYINGTVLKVDGGFLKGIG